MAAVGLNRVASDAHDSSVSILLARWRGGEADALQALTPLIYENLKQIAARYMAGENAGHTLSATALVHEAYLRLLGAEVSWQDKSHFLAIASREMRRVLVDHARSNKRQKRGGEWFRVSLNDIDHAKEANTLDVIAIESALLHLEQIDERKAQVIDLMVFGGLTAVEAAHVLQVSEVTVRREWRMAKAWLHHELLASSTSRRSSPPAVHD
ncbi:MAG: sigma-70 family RNA polymerase sigma factor [Acidobacteria bacterium]|nr:sigma-70 family RNA polymerase sigma factor [Acidobacteriota bacterium]